MKKIFLTLILTALLLPHIAATAQSEPSANVVWREVKGVNIPIPPPTHPRLYLRSEHIPEVKSRMKDPLLSDVWNDLQQMRKDDRPEDRPAKLDFRYYFNQKGVTVRAQLDALNYLTTNDKKLARRAITSMLDTLERASFPKVGDVARAVGLMMTSGAMVYDWCYDQLRPAEKERYVKAFISLAERLECGFPPTRQGSIAGHSSEWMIMRDMLSAGVAIYDEFPEMYYEAACRFFSKHLPARNFFYLGHNYHQGTSYFNVRMTNDLFPLWIFDRMGAGAVYTPAQQFVMYDLIYRRRPDGHVLPSGDENPPARKIKTYSLPAMLAASYYKDEYLNTEYMRNPNVEAHCKIFEFLWRDTSLGTKQPNDLPLSRYSGTPFGWMIARTGWGKESVIAEMKVNEYVFNNHQHHDGGAFQIYYKGPLAIDAGAYQGSSGGYNSPHNKNYFKRTIAHNSLLVFDPEEKFASMGYGGADKSPFVDNDGGQRLPGNQWGECSDMDDVLNTNFRVGTVLAKGFGPSQQTPDYTYLKGDLTQAYTAKVKKMYRSFVFLNLFDKKVPAAMIVFDKIVSSNPNFKKYWLLHSIEEPTIEGNTTTIRRTKDGDSGMLVNTTLLPLSENLDIVPIGGPGKECWVFGNNYPNIPRGGDPRNERGEWRVQISPKAPTAEDYYLNVMQVTDNTNKELLSITSISGKGVVGAQLADRAVLFANDAETLAHPVTFTITGNGTKRILVADLLEGTWQVQKDGKVLFPALFVNSTDGILYFEGSAGNYKLLR